MSKDETLEDTPSTNPRGRPVLFEVLSYDTLGAVPDAVYALSAPRVTLGRGDTGKTRVGLNDRFASSEHARIDRKGTDEAAVHVLRDLGSRNGVFLNGERLPGEARLMDGDIFEIGHTLLCYRELPVDQDGTFVPHGRARTRAPAMVSLTRHLRQIASSREPVLLLGETGVGKDVAARFVHDESGRAGSFVAIDCGAVPEGLFESMLFGHVRGAFTGATEARDGEIAKADNGSLFLDEIANTTPAVQAKLLRVLEDGRVRRVGDDRSKPVDVRWLAATNQTDLQNDALFRGDLLQRLAGFVTTLPPLRQRREDLGALTACFLEQLGRQRVVVTPAAGRKLFGGALTGNVRRLRAALRTAVILAGDRPIGDEHVISLEHAAQGGDPDGREPAPSATPAELDAVKLASVLRETKGNIVRAAEVLRTHPRQVYRFLDRFDIDLDALRKTLSETVSETTPPRRRS